MAFDGWPAEAVEFYAGLEDDNSKSYWTGHKGLTAWQHWGTAPWLRTSSAADRLQSFFRTGAALSHWLDVNVTG